METLYVSTQLVTLDATILDENGRIVTQNLTRDDFEVEEDKQPQTILSFESVTDHRQADATHQPDRSRRIIFVLDELNFQYEPFFSNADNSAQDLSDENYERTQLLRFLELQPQSLPQPTEVLTLTHHGYRTLVPLTFDRDLILETVKHHNAGLGSPFLDYIEESGYGGIADGTLSQRTMQAIWALALQQRSVPGRKLIVWLGFGGTSSISSQPVDPQHLTPGERNVREITNLLVDARVTLDLFPPGIGHAAEEAIAPGEQDPASAFESNLGFTCYIAATGGQFSNGNDIRGEIQQAENYASTYYTLTYRPANHLKDGKFRRIRISIRNHPDWKVLTEAGYYAIPPFSGEKDALQHIQTELNVAAEETMPFSAISANLLSIQRIQGTDQARFTLQLNSQDLQWQQDPDSARQQCDVTITGLAIGSVFARKALSSRTAEWRLTAPSTASSSSMLSTLSVTLPIPRKAQRLRIVIRDNANGRLGTVDVTPATILHAPFAPPAAPNLQPRPVAPSRSISSPEAIAKPS